MKAAVAGLLVAGSVVGLSARRRAPASGPICPGTALLGVYHPWRLRVLNACTWYSGTVTWVSHEGDGDYHVNIAPDPGYGKFLDADNCRYEGGALVTEIMPGQSFPTPWVGESIVVFGTFAYDANHGWNEIHPIWTIKYLDTGRTISSLPPAMPIYQDPSDDGSAPPPPRR